MKVFEIAESHRSLQDPLWGFHPAPVIPEHHPRAPLTSLDRVRGNCGSPPSPAPKAAEEKAQRPSGFSSGLGGSWDIFVALWPCLLPAERPQQSGRAWSWLRCQAGTVEAAKGTGKGYICACRFEIRADLPFTPN